MGDVVDAILDQWQRERPELDVTPMSVTVRVARLAALLERGLEDTLVDYGLAGWEFEALASLRRMGSPFVLTVGRLQGAMMISSGTLAHRIGRLEKRGFVARTRTLTHRRASTITLTAEGRSLVDEVIQSRLNRERELLAALPAPDQQQLAALLRQLLLSLNDR